MASSSDYLIKQVNGVKHNDVLLKLQKQCLPADTPLAPFKGWWWIAYKDKEPAAFACLKSIGMGADEVGSLDRAGVLWSHRGKRLQARLIHARVRKARQLGWRTALSTTHDNPASGNNLFRCGFRMYTPAYPWMTTGTVYWYRKLTH